MDDCDRGMTNQKTVEQCTVDETSVLGQRPSDETTTILRKLLLQRKPTGKFD